MEKEKIFLLITLLLFILLFIIGFICVFFSMKLKNWYINLLNVLYKKRSSPLNKFSLGITKKNWFIINLRVCGILEMLFAILMVVLIIYRLRYPDRYR
ncbi:hypothetical protein BH11BAC3_BH11BAC3_14350 [soil metagenome]